MKRLALSALLPLALLAACDTAEVLDFDFRVTPLAQTPNPAPSDTITQPSDGVLLVARTTTTPCWNDGLTARGGRDGGRLTLTVSRVAAQPCTDDRDRSFRYQAVFGGLRTGSYQVRVVEQMEGAPRVVQDTTLRVD